MTEAGIRQLSAERGARIRRLEFDDMVSAFYAHDAILMPSGAAATRGIEAIGEFWRTTPDHGLVALTLEIDSVEVSGDIGYEIGGFNRTLRPRHGAPFQERGKYLVVYRHEGGVWRAAVEMFNTDTPR